VLPGFVETEGFPQKGVLKSPLLGRFVIGPQRVAEAVLRAVEKGKREITVPWFPYRFVSILQALAPGLVARFVGMSDYKTHPDEKPAS
jgi:short-subunit dehydrogenase